MGKINENDIANILNLYKNGESKSSIAKKYNVSTTTIYRKIIEFNMDNDINKFSDSFQKQIVEEYNEYKNASMVANNHNMDTCYILCILRENGVTPLDKVTSHRKYSFNENYFQNIDTPNKAYILGLIYADGCNCKSDRGLHIHLQENDKELLEDINREMENTKPLGIIKRNIKNINWKDMYKITIYSEKMQKDLLDKGVMFQKTMKLKYPYWLRDDLHSHFMRGYFDGDGSVFQIYGRNKKITCIDFTGTEDMCLGFQTKLKEAGIHSNIFDSWLHNGITKNLHIKRKDDVMLFFNWIYKDKGLYMKRKYDRFIKYLDINNSLSA